MQAPTILGYKDANSAKWRRVRHLIDPEPDGDFKQDQVDLEGDESKTAPIALDGENVLQNSVDCEPPNADFPQTPVAMEEQSAMNVDSNSGTDFVDTFGDIYQDNENEMDVADLFGDFDEPLNEDAMVSSLMMAGVNKTKALDITTSMNHRMPTSTFVEVYGRSIRDQSLVSRRNLNIEGLDALDLRTMKPNGEPWNFTNRSDRKRARELIDKLDPEWIIGAPPCTPWSI